MNGEETGFEQIHASFRPKIHRYLTRMVGEQDAEDLTQEVFIRVSGAVNRYRGDASISTWIYRIATHAAYDLLRSSSYRRADQGACADQRIEEEDFEIDDLNTWTGEKTPWVETQLYRKEMSQCMQGFIAGLPEIYRTALVLSVFEDFQNKEIAEILGLTLETVKIRLHRARELLKRALAKDCPSYWVEDNEFLPELRRERSG